MRVDCWLCFAQTGVPHEDEVFRTTHVTPQGQLQNESFGDILHRGKIVIGQFLDEGELRSPDGRLDALGISIRHLGLTEAQQKLLRRETVACSISRIDAGTTEGTWGDPGYEDGREVNAWWSWFCTEGCIMAAPSFSLPARALTTVHNEKDRRVGCQSHPNQGGK
jgi:hypothetical protein